MHIIKNNINKIYMSNFMNKYFGPLTKEYCIYFYILSILLFAIFVFGLISFIILVVKKYKTLESTFYMNNILILVNILIAYFVNRLLHGMCIGSLR
jgi:hypothetical protein